MKKRPHEWNSKYLNWAMCSKCGLLYLKNAASRKEATKPCPGAEKEDAS